jgi:hypothetical protein
MGVRLLEQNLLQVMHTTLYSRKPLFDYLKNSQVIGGRERIDFVAALEWRIWLGGGSLSKFLSVAFLLSFFHDGKDRKVLLGLFAGSYRLIRSYVRLLKLVLRFLTVLICISFPFLANVFDFAVLYIHVLSYMSICLWVYSSLAWENTIFLHWSCMNID